jgi:indolepyruvate ferredoxin oxidoreductase
MNQQARILPASLDDRFEAEEGDVYLSGTQALIRLLFDQQRRDRKAGLRIGTFITGYPGSPLGGIDGSLRGVQPLLDKYNVRHVPAQNEELAANSLIGTQMLDDHPHPDYDGVVGVWYGKGPGVDRSTDGMKHGNFAGTSKHGAVVILSGEDHEAKSSSVPYQQEFAFEHMGIPVLYPADVAEFLEFGLHAVALSRYSGLWVTLKLVGALCDGGQTVSVGPDQPEIHLPELAIDGRPFAKKTDFSFFPGKNVETERNLYYDRHAAVRAYARANHLDRVTVQGSNDKIGIVAAGKTYTDLRQALYDLGFDDSALNAAGIRLFKLGLLCPMEPEALKDFAQGLDEIIVVEEKRDFIERQVGRIVCDLGRPVRVIGKFDEDNRPLFPLHGAFDSDTVASLLGRVLGRRVRLPDTGLARLEELDQLRQREIAAQAKRTPNFCSGCPHNTGTRLAKGQVAWSVPGCHIFAMLMTDPQRKSEAAMPYGADGLPWIGLAPYTSREHIVQNTGDGSLFHSSYLNIRYAVSQGVSMTFKILYNGAIANTGGQTPTGQLSIPDLTHLLAIEGVLKIVIVTKDKSAYNRHKLPFNTVVQEPSDMEETLLELAAIKGVTVMIYDGQCANERRRRQKRGLAPLPTKFTIVNEDVCENCGDCGVVANCMSLQKADTEFGPKTRIHQSSCNQDQSCLQGECPSFVTVRTEEGKGVKKPVPPKIEQDFPEPTLPSVERPFHIYVPGVGGTGVLTANAILAQAVTLDGHRVISYDLTGAAQKWGAVLSSLIIVPPGHVMGVNNVGIGRADLYLALDLLAAADKGNLTRCRPDRTIAVVNSSVLPSGEMIRNVRLKVASDPMVEVIHGVTDRARNLILDARAVAEALFGDYMMTNMVAIGAAYQAGLLPISAASIEGAIALNKVQVANNVTAFRAGRLAVHDPEALDALMVQPFKVMADRIAELARKPSPERAAARDRLLAEIPEIDAATRALVAARIEDLIDYQSEGYARRYVKVLNRVIARERHVFGFGVDLALTGAVARNLHKLMAYKDEYETARLLTQETFRERALAGFEAGATLAYNLQPPLLRSLGLKKKVELGEWFTPVLRVLTRLKRLRGTPLDIFGYVAVRREERRLPRWYEGLIDQALAQLSPANRGIAQQIAEIPGEIRGYEHIKMGNLVTAREQAKSLLAALKSDGSAAQAAE